jgi:hypothetical protein
VVGGAQSSKRVLPGELIAFGRGETLLRPDIILQELKSGKFGKEEWLRQCESLAISGLELAPPGVFAGISA